jgi:putative nucleotidyltransferase with HDIG domain
MNRPFYRVRQFVQYAGARLGPTERQAIATRLGPALNGLFHQMSPAEQAHAYRVAQALLAAGHSEPDLIAAALLHDVGKVRAPLALWERTLVVLCGKLAPRLAERLGQSSNGARGLRRPFVTASQHAAWGADMVRQAGASDRVVALIRCHQSTPSPTPRSDEERWLAALRRADESS